MVGDRSGETAKLFYSDLASRLSNRIQITTDGIGPTCKRSRVLSASVPAEAQKRYSPPVCVTPKRQEPPVALRLEVVLEPSTRSAFEAAPRAHMGRFDNQ
jgi:hypothetical protein